MYEWVIEWTNDDWLIEWMNEQKLGIYIILEKKTHLIWMFYFYFVLFCLIKWYDKEKQISLLIGIIGKKL